MPWHELRVGMDHTGTGERVWKLLWTASVAGEQPDEGSAIFMFGGHQGTRSLYFPPCASVLAASVGARSCVKPDPEGLTVLAGRPGAWDVHFAAPRQAATPMRRRAGVA